MTRTPTRRILSAFVIGVAFVAVPAVPAAAGGGGCHQPPLAEGTAPVVEMDRFCMSPTVLRVQPGTAVTFTNRDPVLHNLFGLGFGYGDLAPGVSVSHTFADAGTFPYACTLHPGMVGTVVVGEGAADLAAARPVATVTPADPDDGGAGAPLVIGLLGIALAGGSFLAGARLARGRAA